jgi:ubiquinone/menaquinone biosynthesis C-methylase UbiE
MSDLSFKMMLWLFKIIDLIYPSVDKRAKTFGICEGMTIVDYGCGPGRYTTRFARLVGPGGKVYAVDVQELALETVKNKAAREGLGNIATSLAKGYDSGLPDRVADMVFALDMFFSVREPTLFLTELRRILKPDGVLIIDDGHQPRATTKRKIVESRQWNIVAESADHLTCRPA